MGKTAFICSGQGSQYAGMGRELYDNFPEARRVYECAGDILGYDLKKLSFEGKEAEIGRTAVSQPAIFAVSLAARAALGDLLVPDMLGGHSLGEYAALCIGGAFSMEDGFRVIDARARAMQRAADENPGAMYAILGCFEENIREVCAKTPGFVEPVNFNARTQTVIAGDPAAAEAAAGELSGQEGVKAVKLGVSSAFHCRMMAGAAEEFKEAVRLIPMSDPQRPFYCNLTGKLLPPGTDLKGYLCRHIVSPVHFHEEISAMIKDGADAFVELGPGRVLSSLVKRGFKGVSVQNVENLKTLEKCRAAFS